MIKYLQVRTDEKTKTRLKIEALQKGMTLNNYMLSNLIKENNLMQPKSNLPIEQENLLYTISILLQENKNKCPVCDKISKLIQNQAKK